MSGFRGDTPDRLALLFDVLAAAERTGQPRLSNSVLAQRMGVSLPAITQAFAKLVSIGAVHAKRGGRGHPIEYSVLMNREQFDAALEKATQRQAA